MSKKENCIFISINKSFFKLLKICLESISKNYTAHPDIIICHTDLTDKDITELKKITNKIIPLKNNLKKHEIGPIMNHLPKNIDPRVFYARFLIWKLHIFRKYNAVLHLDADTIILKDCNEIFYKKDFYIEQESYSGPDSLFIDIKDKELIKKAKKDKINIKQIAGNAGIFMIPSKYINIFVYKELINILGSYKDYIKWADQSIINIWLQKRSIKTIDINKYNFQHRVLMKTKKSDFLSTCSIVHFNGVPDPYRVYFMKLLLKIGLIKYKILYISFIGTLNFLQKIRGKPVYNIY